MKRYILFSFVALSSANATDNRILADGFEPEAMFIHTDCGIYDRQTGFTWSYESYECEAFSRNWIPDDQDPVEFTRPKVMANLNMCLQKANVALAKRYGANCKGVLPFWKHISTLRDKDTLPNVKKDGVTVFSQEDVSAYLKAICGWYCYYPSGIDFSTGEEVNFYKELPKKHYVRLVMTS